MRAKNKRSHRMLFVVAEGQPMIAFRAPYSDAKKAVEITLASVDALNGKPGFAGECLYNQCVRRLAPKFPHPVIFAEVTDSRVWIVDRMKNGRPSHIVRYTLSRKDSDIIKLYDSPGGKAKVLAAGLMGKTVRLLAPTRSVRGVHARGSEVHIDSGKHPINPVTKGSWARAARAGVFQPHISGA